RAAGIEEILHRLAREAVHDLQTARAIGRPRAVAEIEIVIVGQPLNQRGQYRQSAEPRVKDSNHALVPLAGADRRRSRSRFESGRQAGPRTRRAENRTGTY